MQNNDIIMIDPDQRQAAAEEYFLKGYNCCQSVLMAFRDVIGLDEDATLKLSSGLGGGMARMREVCGTVTAMAVIAGFLLPACDPSNMDERTANYALVQDLAGRFRERKGSILCRDLLGLSAGVQAPAPSERTAAYYKERPCTGIVGLAARIVAEYMVRNREEIAKKSYLC